MKKNLGDKIIWRLNIVDLILIGLVLLSVLALIYKFVWTARNNPETEFVFTYICEKAPTDVLAGINAGDKCADGD